VQAAAAALPVLALHGLVVHRVCRVSYSWPALAFSPGLAWSGLLAAALLAAFFWGSGQDTKAKEA
jgi:hypothetical protein